MSASDKTSFSGLRAFLWPVHRHELKRIVPLLCIFFLLAFNYNVLRCMKDTFVVTAKNSGAEVIPFIKVWVMFPMSCVLTWVFIRLSNHYSRERVFYTMLSFFLLFFAFFATVLYPLRDFLHPHESADRLQAFLPVGLKGIVAMYRYWTYTAFYAMAELWSNIVLFLLLWGFVNQVTQLAEAKRFYGIFGVGVNLSGIAAGQISILVTKLPFDPSYSLWDTDWGQSMTILISLIILSTLVAMYLFNWIHKNVLAKEEHTAHYKQKEKPVFSMKENLKRLAQSKYLRSIALILISYNIVINFVEIMWKHELRQLYPLPADYNNYMNQLTTIIGVFATCGSFLISGNVIRRFGWTFSAMITPIILLVTSIGFFGCFFLHHFSDVTLTLFGSTPLALVVFFGSLQNCLSRTAKYTLFDATKEMAFVPLDK